MNEQELRDGLREVMAASSQPPPMNPNSALDAAKRAHKRRRATWAGAGAGATVVALAAGTVFALAPTGETLPIGPAAAQAPVVSTTGSAADAPDSTQRPWPNGQTDRTARSGPRANTADGLLDTLKAALPDTLTVDTKTTHPGGPDTITRTQAQFTNYFGTGDKQEAWEYLVTAAVTRKSSPGIGQVLLSVYTPGNETFTGTDICALAPKFWGVGGACTTRVVQGKTVGVITKTEDQHIDTVAGFRYDDGTVVFLAQSEESVNDGSGSSMATPPLEVDQLAQMVLNPAFKVQ